MKVTLHLEGSRQEVLSQIAEFKLVLETSLETQKPASAKAEKAPAPAKKKAPKQEEETFDDNESEDVETSDEDMDAEEPDESEDEEPVEDENDDVELTHKDVLTAFKNYAAKGANNRAKALKILAKYKVEAVKDLKQKDFKAVIAQLK